MESTERLVRTWMASGRDDEVQQIVTDITSGNTSLLNVVRALGEYLPAEEDMLRTKGVDLLSQVISRCPPRCISRQATLTLVNFYSSKLDDQATVIPAIKGLLPLSALSTFNSVDAVQIFQALVKYVSMREQMQNTRYAVFQVIDSLMARHRSAMRNLGSEFLDGYIGLADGEKDPRNLLVAFAIDRVICIEFDISKHIDEIFNIIFCYFPITFKPPPDDPYGITADDLKKSLLLCLAASPEFGHLAIPLFLEKLFTGSPLTKGNILDTISVCLPVYGADIVQDFAKKLYNAFKLEIFQPVNPEIEEQALKAIQALVCVLYGGAIVEPGDSTQPGGILQEICAECVDLLSQPEKTQAVPASKVTASLVGTVPFVTQFALSQAIPHLLSLFRNKDEVVHRPQILTLLCVIIRAVDINWKVLCEDSKGQLQLLSYKDDILSSLIVGVQADDSREAALDGLKRLTGMTGVLTDDELVYIVHNVNEVLQACAEGADMSSNEETLDLLLLISKKNSKIVEESTLPMLFSLLPDSAPSKDAHHDRLKYWQTLAWLEKLCTSASLFETLAIRLMTKLDILCSLKSLKPEKDSDYEPIAAFAHSLLKTLANVLQVKVDAKHSDVQKHIDRIVPKLYNLFFFLASNVEIQPFIIMHPRLLEITARVVTIIVRTLPVERQQKFADGLGAAYLSGNYDSLASGLQNLPPNFNPNPLAAAASAARKDLVILLAEPLVGFNKGVFIPHKDPVTFLLELQSWCLDDAESDLQRKSAYHIIASSVNKMVDALQAFISFQFDSFWTQELNDRSKPTARRRIAVDSWLWILKAVVVRNHVSAMQFIQKLLQLLDDPEIAWDAARAIGCSVNQNDGVLCNINHAVIKALYAQKNFRAVLPLLLAEINDPIDGPRRRASLVALSSLISSLPKAIYVNDMPMLMPFLIRGLDLEDPKIRANIINTFVCVSESGPSGGHGAISEHASTLVSVASRNALPQAPTSQALRVTALKLLAIIPRAVRYDILHPQKVSVLRELAKALDDPKRAVRKEAILARTAWFLYQG